MIRQNLSEISMMALAMVDGDTEKWKHDEKNLCAWWSMVWRSRRTWKVTWRVKKTEFLMHEDPSKPIRK